MGRVRRPRRRRGGGGSGLLVLGAADAGHARGNDTGNRATAGADRLGRRRGPGGS